MKVLRWWIIICLTGVGLFFLVWYDGLNYINDADFTKLSFLILALFIYGSIQIGWQCKNKTCSLDDTEIARFICRYLPKLGLLGTIIGMMQMLYAFQCAFQQTGMADITKSQVLILGMISGMSTALVTTATGLICHLILRVEIFSYDYK